MLCRHHGIEALLFHTLKIMAQKWLIVWVPFKMINISVVLLLNKTFYSWITILAVAESFYCFLHVTVPSAHCLQISPVKIGYMRYISETGVQHTTYTWCNILIRPHFPVHIKGIPKWDTHLYMPLECRVHHLACTAQRREHIGIRQVLTFAHVWWWNIVWVKMFTLILLICSVTK